MRSPLPSIDVVIVLFLIMRGKWDILRRALFSVLFGEER